MFILAQNVYFVKYAQARYNKTMKKSQKNSIDKKVITIIVEAAVIFAAGIYILLSGLWSRPARVEDNSEIERKWLVRAEDIPYNLEEGDKYDIYQTYINFSPEIRVRNINNGEFYVMTVKTDDPAFKGLRRTEQEYFITEEEYADLMAKNAAQTIHKTRYSFRRENGRTIEFDIFHDQLDGLAYMEIEFPSTEEADAYETPDFVVADITRDLDYKNGHLARFGIPESFDDYLEGKK